MYNNIVVARQAIHNREKNLVAYELLYRENNHAVACSNTIEDDLKDTKMLLSNLEKIGRDKVLDDKIGFYNINLEILNNIDDYNIPLNSVLEVMEFDVCEKNLIAGISYVRDRGYRVALDDFLYKHKNNDLINYVDLIKVDYIDCSRDEIKEIVEIVKSNSRLLLAEKIETEKDFKHAYDLGFDLYQGYYFSRPEIIE